MECRTQQNYGKTVNLTLSTYNAIW